MRHYFLDNKNKVTLIPYEKVLALVEGEDALWRVDISDELWIVFDRETGQEFYDQYLRWLERDR